MMERIVWARLRNKRDSFPLCFELQGNDLAFLRRGGDQQVFTLVSD